MNSKQFLVLFFNLALFSMAMGFGDLATLTTVAFNGALTVPLLTATAGTLAGPLAVLGVLKLGAAALFALGYLGNDNDDQGYEQESSGYGRFFRRRHRVQRSAEEIQAPNQDSLFALIAAMDTYGCGKQLVCELEAKRGVLAADEALLLKLFGDRKMKKSLNPASAKAEYELAADLGIASKNELLCRARYATCPYNAEEMMSALRNSQL